MTLKSVACQATGADSPSTRGLRVVQAVSTICTHTASSAAPRRVAGGSNRHGIDPPVQGQRSWTTDGLHREGGYCTERGGESQEQGGCQARLLAHSIAKGLRLAYGAYGSALWPGL